MSDATKYDDSRAIGILPKGTEHAIRTFPAVILPLIAMMVSKLGCCSNSYHDGLQDLLICSYCILIAY